VGPRFDRRFEGNIDIRTGGERGVTFSERLVRPLVSVCSDPGDLGVDPFAGSGTMCRTAAELGPLASAAV
jgi:DNA modification methylase